MARYTRTKHRGFTLVELLTVIAIIALLGAILFPVFGKSREKARQIGCLSNERQLGMAVLQYVQDYDETFPNGFNQNHGWAIWSGEGWAGQCLPYIKNSAVFHCLSDPTTGPGAHDHPVSYGYNFNLIDYDYEDPSPEPSSGVGVGALTACSRTVLLFEVSNVSVNLSDPLEGSGPGGLPGTNFSPSGDGLDNRLYAQKDSTTSVVNQYNTGLLGGRPPFNPNATQFASPIGRHTEGSNLLLADGHAKWLFGANVSAGVNASAENCNQDNQPPMPGCESDFHAAGTSAPVGATFSIH